MQRFKQFLVLLSIAAVLVAVIPALADAQPRSREASITLTPTSGPAGTTIGINGDNFPGKQSVDVTFDGVICGHGTTGANGTLNAVCQVPITALPGEHTVTVTAGSTSVSSTFTVTI